MAPDLFPARGWVRRRHVFLRKGSSELTAEASDPHIGVRDLLHPSGPPIPRGGPEPPCVPEARVRARAFRWKTRPPTAFNADGEACSAAAARGTSFVRPHCAPRITEVHSVAACAAPAQSPSAALNGYDGTALFHHATYAASYTARSAMWQTTPLATPGTVPTGQRLDMMNEGLQEQVKISGERSPLPAMP